MASREGTQDLLLRSPDCNQPAVHACDKPTLAHGIKDLLCDQLSRSSPESIVYTLDSMGNRIKEETRDPSGIVKRVLARQFNSLNQLRSQINAPYALAPDLDDPGVLKTTFTYDANGNLDTTADPFGRVDDRAYDPLDRLIEDIQDRTGASLTQVNAVTGFAYDARGNLRKVKDPNGLSTAYEYDGLNNLLSRSSPDTGITGYGAFDSAGTC